MYATTNIHVVAPIQYVLCFIIIVPVWIAARATSAAPVYFTPCQEKYLDGGVMANNPCQEAMKVITDYDKKCGIPFRHFSLIMSIGTGQYMANEETERSDKGVFLMKHFIQIKEIVNIFLKQVNTMHIIHT